MCLAERVTIEKSATPLSNADNLDHRGCEYPDPYPNDRAVSVFIDIDRLALAYELPVT